MIYIGAGAGYSPDYDMPNLDAKKIEREIKEFLASV